MDDKDPKDEEFNQDEQGNASEADDSFGLPDLEYKPLEEEESGSDEETQPDEEPATGDEAASNSSEPEVLSDTEESKEEEEVESEDEKPALRYQMEENESSNAPKIIGGILGVLALAAIIWYFGFYRPQQQKIADDAQAKQEELDYKKAQEETARKKQAAADAAAAAEEAQAQEEVQENLNAEVQILTERSGRYYIVLESFIDEDFAKDFGNKIAQGGTPSFLIPPYSKKKMQRVGIGAYETLDEAKSGLNNISEEFGTGKWILKY